MHAQFDELFTERTASSKSSFTPTVFIAPYLNATQRALRYNVREVRSQVDITISRARCISTNS
jgi:hypothetical protein